MPWYHGSQQELSVLRPGSSITQNRTIARAFSHHPSAVSQEIIDGQLVVKHNDTTPGYLYKVIDKVGPDDIDPHPHPINESTWEWLTRRELRVRLVERTVPRPEEMLSAEEVAERRRRLAESGQSGSGILED